MAMLAEPRRKLKWSVDPKNSAWSKDESKLGQKMLERMGWSKGKGLGRSEQGATEHIKVKVKNNNLGLGTSVCNEDNWIAHQDDFNQLLAELNNCHGQNTEETVQEQTQGFSLEEKSKTSRKRVHYMKFTKGKDLSNRSETDLACIFGKRSKQAKDQDEASSGSYCQEENSSDKESTSNPEVELNTVTSALTMQEYFAQRMAQLKKGCGSPAMNSNPQSLSTTSASTEDSPNTSDMEQRKKKKRKRDGRTEDAEKVQQVEESSISELIVDPDQSDLERKKKKKKKKQEARDEDTTEEIMLIADDDVMCLSTERKKKKKKGRGETAIPSPLDSVLEHNTAEKVMDIEVSAKKEKKRKRTKHSEIVVEEKKPKKDKKNKNKSD